MITSGLQRCCYALDVYLSKEITLKKTLLSFQIMIFSCLYFLSQPGCLTSCSLSLTAVIISSSCCCRLNNFVTRFSNFFFTVFLKNQKNQKDT